MSNRALDDAPIPLITFERNKYDLGKQALDLISTIQVRIGILCLYSGSSERSKAEFLNYTFQFNFLTDKFCT